MQAKILVAGQKGGVGKSAVSRAIAVALIEAGHDLCVVDYDEGQSTISEWSDIRSENKIKPAVSVISPGDIANAPVQVLDTPGWTSEHTAMLAAIADVILLPTGPSTGDDITPTIRLVYELEEAGIPRDRILIVLNRIHNNDQAKRARDFLAEGGLVAVDGDLRESTHVASLHDYGKTVLDIPTARDQQKAAQCIQAIVDRIEALGARQRTSWQTALLSAT